MRNRSLSRVASGLLTAALFAVVVYVFVLNPHCLVIAQHPNDPNPKPTKSPGALEPTISVPDPDAPPPKTQGNASPDALDKKGNKTEPAGKGEQKKKGDPVTTSAGTMSFEVADFSYARQGFPFEFKRKYYPNTTSWDGEMGYGWTHNYDEIIFINTVTSEATLVNMNGSNRFTFDAGTGKYSRTPGNFYDLETASLPTGISYVDDIGQDVVYEVRILRDRYGVKTYFASFSPGAPNVLRPVYRVDTNGNYLKYTYEAYVSWLEMVEYSSEVAVELGCFCVHYDDVRKVCDSEYCPIGYTIFTQTLPALEYDVRLSAVRGGPVEWSISFEYDEGRYAGDEPWAYNRRIMRVNNSLGESVEFTYDYDNPISPIRSVLREPDGFTAHYAYYEHQGGDGTRYYMTGRDDAHGIRGWRHNTYEYAHDPVTGEPLGVRRVKNGRGQYCEQFDIPWPLPALGSNVQYTTQYRTFDANGTARLAQEDIYKMTVDGPVVQWSTRWIDGVGRTEYYRSYNADGLVTDFEDGNGHHTLCEYDANGNMTKITDAEGNFRSYSYNSFSRVTDSYSNNGAIHTTYLYDPGTQNLMKIDEPLGKTTSFSYFPGGLLQSMTDANHNATYYVYDPNGNLKRLTEPPMLLYDGDGPPTVIISVTQFQYDDRSRLEKITDAEGQATNYIWKDNNLLDHILYADGTTVTYTYDSNGNPRTVTDQKPHTKTLTYDDDDNLTDVSESDGTRTILTHYDYDPSSNRTSISVGGASQAVFEYNEQDRVKEMSDGMGKKTTYAYDGVLNLKTKTVVGYGMTTYSYYDNNRLKTITPGGGMANAVISYEYDHNGNRKKMTDAEGVKEYDYDDLDRLIEVRNLGNSTSNTYAYDPVGNRTGMRVYVGGVAVNSLTYTYYWNNLLESVTDADGDKTTYYYDSMKNVTGMTRPNGVLSGYTYTPEMHRLEKIRHYDKRGSVINRFDYTYDPVGNRDSMTSLTGKTTYGYDQTYQLTSAAYPGPKGTINYQYDERGNRTSMTEAPAISYANNNEIQSGYGETFTHDAAGNMTAKGATTYSWDGLNRLVRVDQSGKTFSYIYNGDNLRVRKTGNGKTKNYVFDGISCVVETDGSNAVKNVYNPGVSVKDELGNKFFYLNDGLGSVCSLTDKSGNIVQVYHYDAFGEARGGKGANQYRFVGSGQVYSDDDAQLQYMVNRWYAPGVGRYISKDPIGFAGGNNSFIYARNNPIKLIDPLGLRVVIDDQRAGNLVNAARRLSPVVETLFQAVDRAGVDVKISVKSKVSAIGSGSLWEAKGSTSMDGKNITLSGNYDSPNEIAGTLGEELFHSLYILFYGDWDDPENEEIGDAIEELILKEIGGGCDSGSIL